MGAGVLGGGGPVTLLLAPDHVLLYQRSDLGDAHGWGLPGADAAWEGDGNLQQQAGRSDVQANDGGGHGPYDPAYGGTGTLYLPEDAPAEEGMAAVCQGRRWYLSQVRPVLDPLGNGSGCLVASVTTAEWD